MTDSRPIVLRSTKQGLSLIVKPGESYDIPGSKTQGMRFGKWIQFDRGQAVVKAEFYGNVWGTREKAVAALKRRRNHGHEFFVVDLPADSGPGPTAGAPKAGKPPTGDAS